MDRILKVIWGDNSRKKIQEMISAAPQGSRVEIKGAIRSLPQNAKLWASISDVAKQKKIGGEFCDTRIWFYAFCAAIGKEVQWYPSLDGNGTFPVMASAADLTKTEASEMIEFIQAWGAQNGVEFGDK
jgi:NinB protein